MPMQFRFFLEFRFMELEARQPSEMRRLLSDNLHRLLSQIILGETRVEIHRRDDQSLILTVYVQPHGEMVDWRNIIAGLLFVYDKQPFVPFGLHSIYFMREPSRAHDLGEPSIYVDTDTALPDPQFLHSTLQERLGRPQEYDFVLQYLIRPHETGDDKVQVVPGEALAVLGARVNDHPATDGPQFGFNCRLAPGFSIQQYISSMYGSLIPVQSDFGGETILLTTLLQINGKIELINYVTERLESAEDMTLYTLSSLNIEIYNRADPHNFCKLVKEEQLGISNIILGVRDSSF